MTLLTDFPAIRFMIETPAGDIIDPGTAAALGASFAVGTNMVSYTFTLPVAVGAEGAQTGTWYALLEVDEDQGQRTSVLKAAVSGNGAFKSAHGIRYSVSAYTYSNLRMEATLSQSSLQPGATMTLRASLLEYGIPVDHRAAVTAELERPDNSQSTLSLVEVEPGIFETSTPAVIQGVYRFRLLASGLTMRDAAFTREQLLSGAVVVGGDNPYPTSGPGHGTPDRQLCDLIECMLGKDMLGRFLIEHKIDPNALRQCVERWCKNEVEPSDEELRQREGTSAALVRPSGAALGSLASEVVGIVSDIMLKVQPSTGFAKKATPPGEPPC